MHTAWVLLILIEEGFVLAQKTKGLHNVGQTSKSAGQCGTWIQNSNGGLFTSPNYPDTYPPNKECVFILEALPRQRIELTFDETYYIEPSFECRFDYIEVRDGPFGFSPLINRFCGPSSPGMVRSTGRFMWIKFSSDEELEGLGFRVKYAFIADPDFRLHVGDIFSPVPDCQFELRGSDGVIHSSQVEEEAKIKSGSAVDCIWTVRAPPRSKIYLRFMEYQMEHSNECKKNFVAVYDGSSAIENLKAKFCSTIANDIMLDNGVAVVRMWADENSRLSRFRLLFTSFVEPPCSDDTFFCHSNMCINNSLVCNGVQNCVYPWDENQCREKSSSLLNQIIRARGTVIGVSAGIVLMLLIISIVVQMKQPRKKILSRKPPLNKAGFQEVFNPPHYNLFSLRDKEMSSDLADLSDDLESYHKLRRNSVASRCIHEHHCGSLASSLKPSQADLSSMELLYHNDFSQSQTLRTLNSTYKKSCCVYKQAHDCADNVIEDRVLEEIPCEIYMHGNKRAASSKHCISMDF